MKTTKRRRREFRFLLPYPPSVNRYWLRSRGGVYISPHGCAFRDEVKSIIASEVRAPLGGFLEVEIAVYPPDERKRDVDNVVKATLDALEYAGVYFDDFQVERLVVARGTVVDGGAVEVVVRSSQ